MQNLELVDRILKEAAQEWQRQQKLPDDWHKVIDSPGITSEAGKELFAAAYLQHLLVGHLINVLVVGGYVE